MITVLLLCAGVILVIGLVFLVMRSGAQGGRVGQSGESAVTKQHEKGGGGRPVV